ncbi:MAG TPA: protein-methionine-sulfoxide reductase heme-binding subunit MsrQ [Bacteroidota bacterium]|nr:protein-methionine-sulfoxide reductase heme-binding subunit MsrQ [Bacteroidota bacterium]
MNQAQLVRRVIKPIVFLLCLLPLGLLVWNALHDQLSANPIDDITDETGTWTLRFIVITLCVTPLRRITGWTPLQQLRRMFGLFAFFYGLLHFTTYIYLDQFFAWEEIAADIAKRPFILVGFTSFVLMIPLAATSTDRITKWMGGKRWNLLHRLIYLTAIGGVIHYLWLVKADTQRPLTYGAIVAVLLGYRLWVFLAPRLAKLRPQKNEDAAAAST